jgi:hypothetical protein
MNTTTPRLRQHLLAELRDLPDQTATTDQLAGQVPDPWAIDRGLLRPATGSVVYRHLVSLEAQGLLRRIKPADSRHVYWQLVAA